MKARQNDGGGSSMFDHRIVCCFLYIIRKYGYPTPADRTLRYLEEMKELGFRSVELEGILPDNVKWMFEHGDEIRDKFRVLNLEMPYFCIILPGLASPERGVAAENLKVFESGCELAKSLRCTGVLDSPRTPFDFRNVPYERRVDEDVLVSAVLPEDLKWSAYWKDVVATYRRACDIASGFGLTFEIHQSFGSLTQNTDAFLYFYEAVGRDNLRFNLDTANLCYVRDNLNLALKRLHGLVDYIHIADSTGTRKEHLPPGKGSIDWSAFFTTLKAIGFRGHLGIDVGRSEKNMEELAVIYRQTAGWLKESYLV